MKLHTTGHVACLLLVCTIILQVYSAPQEDSTWQQKGAADSIKPLTVKPLGTSNVPQDQTNQTHWDTKVTRTTNKTDTEGDSSHGSAEVSKRSADDDSPSGTEDTGDNADDTTTNDNQEHDDTSIEDIADDETDIRRRRNANYEQRGKQRGDEVKSEEDGGLTREAAVVAPLRRRRDHDNKNHTDVSTTEPADHDDTSSDTSEDTESTESSKEKLYRRNETDTKGDSSHGSADEGKRSAEDDPPNASEDTEDNTDDTTTDSSQEQDDASIEDTEDTADDETDIRRRRNANYEQRGKQRGDEVKSEEDGGLTREAAVVAPLRRRREAETSTVGTLDGSPVIVVAPSGIPVKKIPQKLDQTLQKLEKRIDSFEEAVIGQSTVPTVGVLAGDSTKQDNGTIIHKISSYIVH